MIQSYLSGEEYGYDQINVGSDEFSQIFKTLDTDSNIDLIRNRENRIFNKINSTIEQPVKNLFNTSPVLNKPDNVSDMYQIFEKYYEKKMKPKEMPYMCRYPQVLNYQKNNGIEPMTDMASLETEVMELDKKNNMLTVFIFFLVVIILIQYTKSPTEQVRFVVIPESQMNSITAQVVKE